MATPRQPTRVPAPPNLSYTHRHRPADIDGGVDGAGTAAAAIAAHLPWPTSGHTATANTFAKFDAAGAAEASGLIEDAAGNVGIGTTPQAWWATMEALEFAGGAVVSNAGVAIYLFQNIYYDGTNFRYIANGAGGYFVLNGLTYTWNTAPVGVAGAIATLTPRMILNDVLHEVKVPLSITDTTDATSSTTGSNRNSGGTSAAKAIVAGTTIRTGGYTVATLPAGVVGDRAYVTNALAPAYGVAVAGAGAVVIPVFRNATVWICA